MKAKKSDFTIPISDLVASFLECGISPILIERAFIYFSAKTIEDTCKWMFNNRLRLNEHQFWFSLQKLEDKLYHYGKDHHWKKAFI